MEPAWDSRDDVMAFLRRTRNWSRWGADDQLGAVNLVTAEKRVSAAALVRSGVVFSLARPLQVEQTPNNPDPAVVRVSTNPVPPDAFAAIDHQTSACHGFTATHMDALCHAWDENGMWNGRSPDEHISPAGATWGAIDNWRGGIVTRGVLLDIPGYRGSPYVTQTTPVHGAELRAVAEFQGVVPGPGDALVIHCGREAYDRECGPWSADPGNRPGLEATCLAPIREWDCAALVWDMWDRRPSDFGMGFAVHAAIAAYGVAVVDGAFLSDLVEHCRSTGRYEFMLVLAPLNIPGATGCLINPLAIF